MSSDHSKKGMTLYGLGTGSAAFGLVSGNVISILLGAGFLIGGAIADHKHRVERANRRAELEKVLRDKNCSEEEIERVLKAFDAGLLQ